MPAIVEVRIRDVEPTLIGGICRNITSNETTASFQPVRTIVRSQKNRNVYLTGTTRPKNGLCSSVALSQGMVAVRTETGIKLTWAVAAVWSSGGRVCQMQSASENCRH